MPMTPEAKKELGKTIRDLRERLLAVRSTSLVPA